MSIWDNFEYTGKRWVKFEGSGRLGATYQWTVPSGVHLLSVSGCGGGGGGGGGVAGGGGGGAGGVALWHEGWPLEVEPGWVLDIEIGAGGTGGAAGTTGGNGGNTKILHNGQLLVVFHIGRGGRGANGTTGGNVGASQVDNYNWGASGRMLYELGATYLNRGIAKGWSGSRGHNYGETGPLSGASNQFITSHCSKTSGGGAIGLNPLTMPSGVLVDSSIETGSDPSINNGDAPALDTLGLINLWGVGGGGGAGDVGGAGADGWSGVVFIYY